MAKVSCIFRHRGVQLILAFSLARPAILVAGKGRGGMFLFLPISSPPFDPVPHTVVPINQNNRKLIS